MADPRIVQEEPIIQGVDERIAYKLDTTPWGDSPSSVTVVLKEWPVEVDVSATNLSGTASVAGNVITLPRMIDLTAGTLYRLEINFTCSGNVFQAVCRFRGNK